MSASATPPRTVLDWAEQVLAQLEQQHFRDRQVIERAGRVRDAALVLADAGPDTTYNVWQALHDAAQRLTTTLHTYKAGGYSGEPTNALHEQVVAFSGAVEDVARHLQ